MSVAGGARAAEEWIEDFEQGMATAAAENRTALVEFTGTDWCHYCIMLRKNVFPTQEFADFVKKHNLVLVELDFPRAADKITPEQRAKNEKVGQHYNVQGYPTVIVMDGYKQPYSQVVGGAANTAAYLARLQKALDIKAAYDQKVAEAEKLSGKEKIAVLQEALNLVPADCREHHTKLIDDIIAADPDDSTGLRSKRDSAALLEKQLDEMKSTILKSAGERGIAAAINDVRAALLEELKREDLLPFVRLSINAFLSQTYVNTGNFAEALKYMDAAIDAAPDTQEAAVMRKGRPELEELAKRAQQQ